MILDSPKLELKRELKRLLQKIHLNDNFSQDIVFIDTYRIHRNTHLLYRNRKQKKSQPPLGSSHNSGLVLLRLSFMTSEEVTHRLVDAFSLSLSLSLSLVVVHVSGVITPPRSRHPPQSRPTPPPVPHPTRPAVRACGPGEPLVPGVAAAVLVSGPP